MKKILSVLLIATTLLCLIACNTTPQEKSFSKEGITITLTDKFKETSVDGYTACYDSKDAAVFVIKESFSLLEGLSELSLNEYAEICRQSNESKNPGNAVTSDGLTYFEYTFLNEAENTTYKYYTVVFKGTDAFWMVQFASTEANYETQKPNFVSWAKTVCFE